MKKREKQESTDLSEKHLRNQILAKHMYLGRVLLVVVLAITCAALIAYPRLRLQTAIVSTHFAYVPIVLAALWWGQKAIWVSVLLGIWTFGLGRLVPTGEHAIADAARILCFLLVAFAIGAVKNRADAAQHAELARCKELEEARKELFHAERLAAMGQFAAGIAHELNNPLGTVLLYAHLIQDKINNKDPLREDVDTLVQEALRCRETVQGLLNFGRKMHILRAPTDIVAVIHTAVAATEAKAIEKRTSVAVCVPDSPPLLNLDAAKIQQVVINLILNALDAVAEGGKVEVCVESKTTENVLQIQVIDDGCGIPEENLQKLFTPFFSTKAPGRGTGLGLAVSYGIVKQHGGTISAKSARGRGSVFTVQLPVEAKPAPTRPQEEGNHGKENSAD